MYPSPLQGEYQIKILVFNWRDPNNPDAGGAEQFTHQIEKRWVKWGHQVTQFSAAFKGCLPEEEIDGVRIVRGGNRFTVYRHARKFYKDSDRFDVVVDEINTIPFNAPTFVNRGEKLFALIHQLAREFWYYETPFPVGYFGNHFLEDRWLKKYADMDVITVSNSTMDDLRALGFKKLHLVHEGYDFQPLSTVGEKENIPTIIYVGRFKKVKLPDHALKAFQIAKARMPDLRMWMVGMGYMQPKLKKLEVKDVTFYGRLQLEEKSRLVSRAHVIVVPAVREGWGLVVTEANAMGTPAIGYRVPGLRDSIKDGKTGLLCDPNPTAMAETIVSLLSQEEKRIELSKNALEDAKEYNWDRTAREFIDLFEGNNKSE
ncbi:MAG TPA: glycosyltransferase family 4 protein [Methanomassiliicoccales archaeon]